MFDITISTLYYEAGREHSEIPGLYTAVAPRKAARLRAQDQIILYLKMSGSSTLAPAQQQELLEKLAHIYFSTAGPITTGLKAVVTRLNDFLLARNLRSPKEGQMTASFNFAAVHSKTLLLAHAGVTHTFILGKTQVQHFSEGQSGRGLGLGKQVTPRFYQSTIEPGDLLLFSAEPPSTWTTHSLANGNQLTLDHLRRRLLAQANGDLHAAIIKFQAGKGQVSRFRPAPAEHSAAQKPAAEPVTDAPPVQTSDPVIIPPETTPPLSPPVETASEPPASQAEENPLPIPLDETAVGVTEHSGPASVNEISRLEEVESTTAAASENVNPTPPPIPTPTSRLISQAAPRAGQPSAPGKRGSILPSWLRPKSSGRPAKTSRPVRSARPAQAKRPAGPSPVAVAASKTVRPIYAAGASASSKTGLWFQALRKRLFPNRTGPLIDLSPAWMLFIAICVPLVAAVVGTSVYFYAGRTEQMGVSLYYAQEYADRARQDKDIGLQRDHWTQVVLWVQNAEQYGQSDKGNALRKEALGNLDQMDGIERLDFRPAFQTPLGADVTITRMAATLNDVYLLDSSVGRIIRLFRTGTGYEVDSTFTCGPGKAGGLIIGPIVDLATLAPNNEYRATIMGVDASGNVVYCAPNQQGYSGRALPPPDTNWGKVKAITTYGDMLYILDPQVNAVWSFYGSSGLFEQRPRLFFDSQVPKMSDVVDLAVDQEFLYLLHGDGYMTLCESTGFDFSPTRCADPSPYGDGRSGREPSPLKFDDAHFTQMQVTTPPDPSLFILDDRNQSVYHFSLRRLNFQRQYRTQINSDFPFPEQPATSFVVTPNRRILIAFQNKIFFAPIP